jgi:hypothetical protein
MRRAIKDRDLSDTRQAFAPVACEKPSLPQLLTEKLAAAYTGISLASLRRGRAGEQRVNGRTPMPKFVKVNSRVYYPLAELDRWLSELQLKEVIS